METTNDVADFGPALAKQAITDWVAEQITEHEEKSTDYGKRIAASHEALEEIDEERKQLVANLENYNRDYERNQERLRSFKEWYRAAVEGSIQDKSPINYSEDILW